MACFTIPLAEAVVVSAVKALAFKRNADGVLSESKKAKIMSVREKLGTLEKMLYGGSLMLVVDHVYNGELSFAPPFLTAMATAEGASAALREMSTVGVGMAVLVTAAWGIYEGIRSFVLKRKDSAACAA